MKDIPFFVSHRDMDEGYICEYWAQMYSLHGSWDSCIIRFIGQTSSVSVRVARAFVLARLVEHRNAIEERSAAIISDRDQPTLNLGEERARAAGAHAF